MSCAMGPSPGLAEIVIISAGWTPDKRCMPVWWSAGDADAYDPCRERSGPHLRVSHCSVSRPASACTSVASQPASSSSSLSAPLEFIASGIFVFFQRDKAPAVSETRLVCDCDVYLTLDGRTPDFGRLTRTQMEQ